MAKFKIGDLIIGNSDTRYDVTKTGWKGVVTNVSASGDFIYAKGIEEYESTGSFSALDTRYFDLYIKPTAASTTSVLTRSEAFRQLFGGKPDDDMCMSAKCSECPLHANCDSTERSNWWNTPFTETITKGIRVTRPRLTTGTTIVKSGLEGLCEAYNTSDSACLAYLADKGMCKTEEQKKELETLVLLNELLFIHNSEICSHEDYRQRYTAFLSEFGIAFDNKGFAYIEKKEDD